MAYRFALHTTNIFSTPAGGEILVSRSQDQTELQTSSCRVSFRESKQRIYVLLADTRHEQCKHSFEELTLADIAKNELLFVMRWRKAFHFTMFISSICRSRRRYFFFLRNTLLYNVIKFSLGINAVIRTHFAISNDIPFLEYDTISGIKMLYIQ